METGQPIQRKVTLGCQNGLHLTPIQKLVQRSMQYQADVRICFDGKTASTKSAMEMMLLGATFGAQLTLRATGPDAEEAVAAVSEIIAAEVS